MKRFLVVGVATLGLAAALPSTVSAETTTTVPTVPTQCVYTGSLPIGPSRALHGSNTGSVRTIVEIPDCGDIAGICATPQNTTGPSRFVHGRTPQRVMPPPAPTPCVPLDPACAFTFEWVAGPQRVVHQQQPSGRGGIVVDIPAACEEAMVLALTPTGSDTAPTIWIATAFLGAGAALIIAPRRLVRR